MSAFTHNLGQVTYPKMERQDLTQGQLGSFKFTPTDDVNSIFPYHSPILLQQSATLSGNDTHSRLPKFEIQTLPSNYNSASQPQSPSKSPTRINSSFFDTYIKPDLDKSRLLFGPNALRAAVDGPPTSPQRAANNFEANPYSQRLKMTGPNIPSQNGTHTHNPFDPTPMSNHTQARITSNPTLNESDLIRTSLIRALASEQEAHQLTKDALAAERAERIKIQAEAEKYLEHNRSLIGSVNMLKSVIQHSMKKEQQATEKAEYAQFDAALQAAKPSQTILHDAVKNLRQPLHPQAAPYEPINNHQLFDFDLLESNGTPALRRHFSHSAQVSDPKAPAETEQEQCKEKDVRERLIDVSPQKVIDHQDVDNKLEKVTAAARPEKSFGAYVDVVLKSKSGNEGRAEQSAKSEAASKTMMMPFDVHVQWTRDSVFDGDNDKFSRLGHNRSIFAEHPVRYLPKKSDKNLYRTVMIDFIPQGTTCKEVLQHIRGGAVESIQMCGPIGHSTDFLTARVVFNYELGASNVYRYGQHPGVKIRDQKVRIWQVLEPTYPRNAELEKEVFDEGFTRLLLIENAVQASLDKLPKKLARQVDGGFVVEIGEAYDGLPMIEFTSILECSKALKKLINDPDFSGCRFDFDDDPCSDPY